MKKSVHKQTMIIMKKIRRKVLVRACNRPTVCYFSTAVGVGGDGVVGEEVCLSLSHAHTTQPANKRGGVVKSCGFVEIVQALG